VVDRLRLAETSSSQPRRATSLGWPRARLKVNFLAWPCAHAAGKEQTLGTPAESGKSPLVRLAPITVPYRITSSACSSIDCGIVTPSALAVFKLIVKFVLFGNCTGRSAGLAPLRIRST